MYTLQFPKDRFSLIRETVDTPQGSHEIEYRFYEKIPYVSRPVDVAFQSMDVKVPVSVDGAPVDASKAPILFAIGVGGYMAYRCGGNDPSEMGPPPDAMPPMGAEEGDGPPPPLPGLGPGDACKGLALAAGFILAEPGCRGRNNQADDGSYYGKAPAGLVDLKAAIRYIRHNKGLFPGDPEKIFTLGGSAGGAMSCLLGITGNSPLYTPYLEEIGAAAQRDDIKGAAALSPIINLENADGAYEWEFGPLERYNPFGSLGFVDQALSAELKAIFRSYQDALSENLAGGPPAADALEAHLLERYVQPSAKRWLLEQTPEAREAYLTANPWLYWDGENVSCSFADYAAHCTRMKGLPAFDDFEMSMAEPILFGNETINARHFTAFSQQHSTGVPDAQVDPEVMELRKLMNPMAFLNAADTDCTKNWWVRHGSCDNHTALPMVTDLTDSLMALGLNVDARLVWDGGHCDNDEPEALIAWIRALSEE